LNPDHKKPIYETHDYSAVEKYIYEKNERMSLSNQAMIAVASAGRMKSIALVIASCGFAVLLVFWGISLLNEEKIRVIEKKVFTGKPTARITSITPQLEEIERSMNRILASNPNKKNKEVVDLMDVTTKFNVFKQVPSGIHGFKDVVTGLVFPNSKTVYPTSQYCYIEGNPSGAVKKIINLADKKKHTSIKYFSYTSVSSHRISPSQFKSAKKKCRFLE
jgi:hypothetical protein